LNALTVFSKFSSSEHRLNAALLTSAMKFDEFHAWCFLVKYKRFGQIT